ncbi:MAG TPA: ArsB/NhaD family transporter [Anaerolineaceae bacterium]
MIVQILAMLLFLLCLGIILLGKSHRTVVAWVGAVLMVILGKLFGVYDETRAIASIDFNTLGLLLGMMVLMALFEPTGFIEFLAIWVAKLSRGRPVRLLVLLGTVTTIASMFLDNVTTVVLIAPVTILICELVGLNPMLFLVAEAVLSNTGGASTLVGDPPNVLVASAAGFTFLDFLVYSMPIIFFCWIAALWILGRFTRKDMGRKARKESSLEALNPREVLREPLAARKVLLVTGLAVLIFLFEEKLGMRPALVALGAAGLGLVWVRPDLDETLKRIPWDILLFFTGLFALIGGLEAVGVMEIAAGWIKGLANLPVVVAGVLMLWITALLSAVVDNIPITIAIIPVLESLGRMGMDTQPLWWALVLGAGLGGNGTIIGATANVVVSSLSEKTRTPITSVYWMKRGFPVMLVTCAVATIVYVIGFTWVFR